MIIRRQWDDPKTNQLTLKDAQQPVILFESQNALSRTPYRFPAATCLCRYVHFVYETKLYNSNQVSLVTSGHVRSDSDIDEIASTTTSSLVEAISPPNSSSTEEVSDEVNDTFEPNRLSNPSKLNISSKENTFNEFYIKADNDRSRERSNADSKAASPSVDELIGSIIQLMSGSHKVNKPLNKPSIPQHHPVDIDLFNNNNMRINNRGPSFAQSNGQQLPNMFHQNVLIGPGPPAGLPLPLTPYHHPKPQHTYHPNNMYHSLNKPSPNLLFPPRTSLNLPENNITGLLGYNLHPHLKDTHNPVNPMMRIPGNNILPKPNHPLNHPLRDRDQGLGSQPQPDFAAPLPSFHHHPRPSQTRPQVPHLQSLMPHQQPHNNNNPHPSRSPSIVIEDEENPEENPETPVVVPSRVQSLLDLTESASESNFIDNINNNNRYNINLNHFPHQNSINKNNNNVDSRIISPSTNAFANVVTPSFSTQTESPIFTSTSSLSSSSFSSLSSSANYPPDMKPTAGEEDLSIIPKVTSKIKFPGEHEVFTTTTSVTNPVEDTSSSSSPSSESTGWLELGGIKASKTWSEGPPNIITSEDQPSVFDITIRHKIGAGGVSTASTLTIRPTASFMPSQVNPTEVVSSSSETEEDADDFSVVATIISTISSTTASRVPPAVMTQSLIPTTGRASPVSESDFPPKIPIEKHSSRITPSLPSSTLNPGMISTTIKKTITSSTRGVVHHFLSDEDLEDSKTEAGDDDVVYGKPLQSNRPIAPSVPEVSASGVMSTSRVSSQTLSSKSHPPSFYRTPMASIAPFGHPVVVPIDMDEVNPKAGPSSSYNPAVVTDPGQGSVYIDGRPTHFKIRPVNPTPATHHPAPGASSAKPQSGSNDGRSPSRVPPASSPPIPSASSQSPSKPPSVRRQPFRPRPVVPLVRIDTCIVGDDTTCDVKMNERCKTEVGISSCQCRPGFGRTTPRGMCSPVMTLAIALRLDKMGDNKLSFSRNYMNPNSEEYQFLEYEATQGFNSMFALSRLAKVYMGVKINKFYTAAGKLLVNASVELEQNNVTKTSAIKRVVQQELSRVIALRNNNIGDSTLSVESSSTSVPRVDDVNECQSSDLNDCSPHALCHNDFGSFRCVCKKGYDDRHASDPKKAGRVCSSCSPSYCNNRGECQVVNGDRECKCRGNFIGSRCDIDVEGESLLQIFKCIIQNCLREEEKWSVSSGGPVLICFRARLEK